MNLKCFHCCQNIEAKVLHMPIDFKNEKYHCEGNFCSIPCMKTYNLELNDSFKNVRFMHINSLASKIGAETRFAPRREELKEFGGTLSLKDFQNKCGKKPTLKTTPPMEVVKQNIESDHTLVRCDSKPSIQQNEVKNEPIRLQRNKPLKNSQNTLEKTMGIFAST